MSSFGKSAQRIFVSFLFAGFATQSFGHVDLLLAFMDEEIVPQTKSILKDHPESNVIIITKTTNGFDGKTLFGFPMRYYEFDKDGRADLSLQNFGESIQKILNAKLVSVEEKFRKLTHFPSGQKTVENEFIQVLAFSAVKGHLGADCDSNIVIVQSPEMGKEPDLTLEYLNQIFEAVMDLPASKPENGGIHFYQFGTGGAAAKSSKPGDVIHLGGAVYIGSRRVGDSFQQNLSVIYGEDLKEIDFYKSHKLFATTTEAIDDLRKQMGNPKSELYQTMEKNEAAGNMPRNIEIGFTGNLFFGEVEKEFGGRFFSSKVVDMEDYLFLQVIKKIQERFPSQHIAWEADRLVCDPFTIPQDITTSIKRWAKSVRYSVSDYADFVWWGAIGQAEVSIPKNARWDFHFRNSAYSRKKNEVAVLDGISKSVVDPFAAEIGTDFVADLKTRASDALSEDPALAKRGKQYFINLFMQSDTHLTERDIDDSSLENSHFIHFLQILAAKATIDYEEIKEAVLKNSKETSDKIVINLLTQDLEMTMRNGKRISLLGGNAINAGKGTEPKLQVWIRDNKWPGVKAGVLLLKMATIDAAAIDRGFYKAGLLYGMKVNASYVSEKIAEEPRSTECKVPHD